MKGGHRRPVWTSVGAGARRVGVGVTVALGAFRAGPTLGPWRIGRPRGGWPAGGAAAGPTPRPSGPLAVAVAAAALYAVGVVAGTIAIGRLTDRVVVPALRPTATSSAPTIVGARAAVLAIALVRSVGIMGRRYFGNMASKRSR